MSNPPFISRDLSWLSFNYRVLQEAKDPAVPLLERLKFLAIYSSNLDEFFRVRVANVRNLKKVGKKTKAKLDFDPGELMREIQRVVNKHQEELSDIFIKQIVPELRRHNIRLLRRLDLDDEQRLFVESYFNDNLLPYAMPVLLLKKRIRPFLANAHLYLAVNLRLKRKPLAEDEFAIVKVPSDQMPRYIRLPSSGNKFDMIMLDDIVRHNIALLFPGYDIVDTYSIKLSRDAELYIDDEYSGDLLQKIKNSLLKRQVGPPSRFVYDRDMPAEMLAYLQDTFEVGKNESLPEGRYHNNFDFFKFPDFGLMHLRNKPLAPLPHPVLTPSSDFFKEIAKRDLLMHVPYQSYEPVIEFLEKAAADENVTHIKVIQYRVAKHSRVIGALMKAIESGKQVSVFVEIKARFDEAANLEWGEKMEKLGIRVYYSFPGVKVHSKLALIRREEETGTKLYSYLSTGNFHEETAKIYGDFGLFTADPRLTADVSQVFSVLENLQGTEPTFNHLLVGRYNLRPGLYALIDKEIEAAKKGKPASMILKMNSIEDKEMITKLYEASQKGVKITMIVRGICCLMPGVAGVSENIEVFSIVDRFLEHARVFVFHAGGEQKIFLSSADWMERNLSYRIETSFPIYDEHIKKEILDILQIQMNDNVKSRKIDRYNTNEYRRVATDIPVRSQLETYFYYKRHADKNS